MDAVIVVPMALTPGEPQASGIGGAAFALHWHGTRPRAWDGRETAPAAVADRALYLADPRCMTTSVQTAWGSRIPVDGGTGLAGGFLLNNRLTDFSFTPHDGQSVPIATACSRANGPGPA